MKHLHAVLSGSILLVLSACAGHSNPIDRRALHIGDDLLLTLTDGKTVTLHGDRKGCNDGYEHCQFFTLEASPPASHWFSVFDHSYEGGTFFLIDTRTGHKTEI